MNFRLLPLALIAVMITTTSILPCFGQVPKGACADLMVSEVKFGKEIDANGNITAINHAVELFNTTDDTIDLGLYTLELVPDTGMSTVMYLSGSIASHDTYVLTNVNSSNGIIALADAVELLLLFDGQVSIELKKGAEVKDKIGKEGVSNLAIDIDLNQLIADPIGYLENAEIDLGSIENLTIKRKPIIQKGKSSFDVESFLEEWDAYPESFSQGLGEHANACMAPVVGWTLTQMTVNENVGAVQAELSISGNQPDWVDVFYWDINDAFETPWAFGGQDYNSVTGSFQIPPFNGPYYSNAAVSIIDDSTPEPTEWFTLQITSTSAILGNSMLDLKLTDNDGLSVEDQFLQDRISVFPTVFNNELRIESDLSGIEILEVILSDASGRMVRVDGGVNETMWLKDFHGLSDGYVSIFINTNKGRITKKLLRITTE